MIFYTDIKCSWAKKSSFHLEIDAPDISVAVAMANAWIAGFRVGSPDMVSTLEIVSVTPKRARGVKYFPMQSWDQIRIGVHD